MALAASVAQSVALDKPVVSAMAKRLPAVAERTVGAIIAEVPSYADALSGPMGANIQEAVRTALRAFLSLAEQSTEADPSSPMEPAVKGAYALGRGEARSGRTAEALLAAYRVGARVAWQELSETALRKAVPASSVASFAGLVFAYIDQLSAASVAGHTDETLKTGRVRQRYLDTLTQDLLAGAAPDVLAARAERAGWVPPEGLAALVIASDLLNRLPSLDKRTLQLSGDQTELVDPFATVLLVPVPVPGLSAPGTPAGRAPLLRALAGVPVVVGPSRPWTEVAASYQRARRCGLLAPVASVVDTEEHLVALTLSADPSALDDLRARVLAPLAGLRESARSRAVETLRAWLLHQGRREDVAAALHVHPQTVRYWMAQVRELFGDALTDPALVQELVIALAA